MEGEGKGRVGRGQDGRGGMGGRGQKAGEEEGRECSEEFGEGRRMDG